MTWQVTRRSLRQRSSPAPARYRPTCRPSSRRVRGGPGEGQACAPVGMYAGYKVLLSNPAALADVITEVTQQTRPPSRQGIDCRTRTRARLRPDGVASTTPTTAAGHRVSLSGRVRWWGLPRRSE